MSTINLGVSLADLQQAMFFATDQYTRGAEPIDPPGTSVTIPPSDPSGEGTQAPSSGVAGAEAQQQGIPSDDVVMSFMAYRA